MNSKVIKPPTHLVSVTYYIREVSGVASNLDWRCCPLPSAVRSIRIFPEKMRAAKFAYIDTKFYNTSFYMYFCFCCSCRVRGVIAMYVPRSVHKIGFFWPKKEDSFIQSLLQPHVHAIPPTLWPLLSLACNSAYIWLYGT